MCGAHNGRALQKRPQPLLPPPRQPPLLLGQNRLTCPCQAHNAKTRRRRAARARARSTDDARRRRSPDHTDALAHRNSPRAGPRSLPSLAWIGFALLYCRIPEKALGRLGRRDDQEKDDGDDAPTQGYPMVPVAPRSALPIARASDGHQRRRIGDRHFE